jgi:hypothetical protein
MTDVCLLAQPLRPFLDGHVPPRPVGELDPLALARSRVATVAEHRLQVVPGRSVRRDDGDRAV